MATIEYDEKASSLWMRTGKRRYFLCQASGEFVAASGRDISDYYWDGHADEVKALFRSMDGLELPVLYDSIQDYVDKAKGE